MGFFSKLKFVQQMTSASVKARLDRDDSAKKAMGFKDTLAKLEHMEQEMSIQASRDTGLNPILSTLRKTIAICGETVSAYEIAASVCQATLNAVDAWATTYNTELVQQTLEASAIAINRAEKLHAEGAGLLNRFQTESMAYCRAELKLS
jgi:predicted Zn-dependent protease